MRLCTPLVAALSTSVMIGCTAGPDFERPAKPASTRYTPEPLVQQTSAAAGPGGAAQTFVPAKDIPGDWWTLFQSPQLDSLIKESLRANPDIDAAQAALRQARRFSMPSRRASSRRSAPTPLVSSSSLRRPHRA